MGLNTDKRTRIFEILKNQLPDPTTELNYDSEFELLIAVILSAQATDISVNKATEKLFKVANTPEAILKLGKTRLKQYIRTIGLFNTKADNIIKTCRMLIAEYGGDVPDKREAPACRPSLWTPIYSGFQTGQVLPLAKMSLRWRKSC
jgi:endonuclease-3